METPPTDENRAPARRQELFADLDRRAVSSGRPLRSGSAPTRPASGQVFLMIDCSSSMWGDKIDQAKSGAMRFSDDAFRKGYKVGIISFAAQATLVMDTTSARRTLPRAMEKLEAVGSTNMTAGLALANARFGDATTGARAVLLVTDGFPDERETALEEARRLHRRGVRVITIGTDDADLDFLRKLSSHEGLSNYVPRDQLSMAMKSASRMLPITGGKN